MSAIGMKSACMDAMQMARFSRRENVPDASPSMSVDNFGFFVGGPLLLLPGEAWCGLDDEPAGFTFACKPLSRHYALPAGADPVAVVVGGILHALP